MKTLFLAFIIVLCLAVPVFGMDVCVGCSEPFTWDMSDFDYCEDPTEVVTKRIDLEDIKKALELALKYLGERDNPYSDFSQSYILPNWDEESQLEHRLQEIRKHKRYLQQRNNDIGFIKKVYDDNF